MENIDLMFKKIIFNMDSEEQKKLLKLYKNYKNIKKIDNYQEIEKKIYSKQLINNDIDKIKFEIQRIKKYIKTKNNVDSEIISRLYFIEKTFLIYSSSYTNDIDKSILKEIMDSVIMLEEDLGMKVGLYSELCDYFEKEINNKYEKILREHRIKGNG